MMARKSYDQRLKERWLRKQKKEDYYHDTMLELPSLKSMVNMAMAILPILFRKRNK